MILVPHRSMLAGHFINAWRINKLYIHTYILYPPYISGGGGYYGLVVVTPHPQTLHRSLDNLKNPFPIASIFYM